MPSTVKQITSNRNKFFLRLKNILSGKGVKKHKTTIVFGRKIVDEFLIKFPAYIEAIVVPQNYNINLPKAYKNYNIYIMSKKLFKELDIFNTRHPFIVAPVPDLPEFNLSGELPQGCTLLIPFQNPENVGAVIRSATAFNVQQVVILKEAANPFHPKSIRASSGTVFYAPLSQGPSIKELTTHKNLIITLDMKGKDIRRFDFPEKFMLLPGLEGPGVPANIKTISLKIPISSHVNSLNAAVAASIALYEWSLSLLRYDYYRHTPV